MNAGQEKFYHFILERVRDGKQDEAKALLDESFGRQAEGTFTTQYLADFAPKMLAILKPEHADEVKAVLSGFASKVKDGFTV